MRRSIPMLLATVVFPAMSTAAILIVLSDHFDSFQSVRVAQMTPRVSDAARDLHAFMDENIPRNIRDLEELLGPSAGRNPDSTYAMPLCQNRMVGMGGLHAGPSRAHFEFYPVDDIGGLQAWYMHDSTTVATIVVFLKVDLAFIPHNRQTQNQLGTRVAWDRDHVAALKQALRKKIRK